MTGRRWLGTWRLFLAALVLGALGSHALASGESSVHGGADDDGWQAAGCFIPTPSGVVLTIGRSSGAIQLPMGGREKNESARDTAARETREETGLEVRVEGLVEVIGGGTALLFHCRPTQALGDVSQLQPLDAPEVREVVVVDPGTMRSDDSEQILAPWRFPEDRKTLERLYQRWKARPGSAL